MKERLPQPSPHWAYFLDVDGTLIELAPTPQAVRVDRELLQLVCTIHRSCGDALALISGRSLADLDQLLGLLQLPMAGQHGLERRDGYGNIHRHALSPTRIQAIAGQIAPLRRKHPGLILEDKGATLAIHYRLAPRLGAYLHRLLKELVQPERDGLQVQPGKRVLEIKPAGYDKGSAIQEFMLQPPFSGRKPVFIGDDMTDEHGFAVVNDLGGLTIKVGPGRTKARYRLPDAAAVRTWLRGMVIAAPSSRRLQEKKSDEFP